MYKCDYCNVYALTLADKDRHMQEAHGVAPAPPGHRQGRYQVPLVKPRKRKT